MKSVTAVVALWCLASVPAWAILGQPVQSIQTDQARMQGQLQMLTPAAANGAYTVQQITAPDGSVVREYVSPAGMVFGVAWSGPAAPDLSQLLGAYWPSLRQAMQARQQRRGPLVVHHGSLTVTMGGHMRDLHGSAYVTALAPAAVSAAAVVR